MKLKDLLKVGAYITLSCYSCTSTKTSHTTKVDIPTINSKLFVDCEALDSLHNQGMFTDIKEDDFKTKPERKLLIDIVYSLKADYDLSRKIISEGFRTLGKNGINMGNAGELRRLLNALNYYNKLSVTLPESKVYKETIEQYPQYKVIFDILDKK